MQFYLNRDARIKRLYRKRLGRLLADPSLLRTRYE